MPCISLRAMDILWKCWKKKTEIPWCIIILLLKQKFGGYSPCSDSPVDFQAGGAHSIHPPWVSYGITVLTHPWESLHDIMLTVSLVLLVFWHVIFPCLLVIPLVFASLMSGFFGRMPSGATAQAQCHSHCGPQPISRPPETGRGSFWNPHHSHGKSSMVDIHGYSIARSSGLHPWISAILVYWRVSTRNFTRTPNERTREISWLFRCIWRRAQW